ncbi:MAG TPA: NAD(P)H-hydrate dehydratase [Candidatus Acidoferrum sp.]|nr:NAD(P)H-hydrate dehydratase [Candidatus Acidoferrum sp.]
MKALTAAEMREVDRLTTERYGIPSLQLMENAGKKAADAVWRVAAGRDRVHVCVLCGRGNNGGDGFVTARYLRESKVPTRVFLFGKQEEVHGDAGVNLSRWLEAGDKVETIGEDADWERNWPKVSSCNVIVDAMLGTGLRGAASGVVARAISEVNEFSRKATAPRPALILAVDTPSGLPSDGASTGGPVLFAHRTVSFTAPKVGQLLSPNSDACGALEVVSIGSPLALIEEVGKGALRYASVDEFSFVPLVRAASSHKGSFGHVLIVAGSLGKSGAAILAGYASLCGGSGLTTVASPDVILSTIASAHSEYMTEPLVSTELGTVSSANLSSGRFAEILKGKSVLALGPGLGMHGQTQEAIRQLVRESTLPIVLDADGLNAFAGKAELLKERKSAFLTITPHPGEMARLLGVSNAEVQSDRLKAAVKGAGRWNCHVILKGVHTLIVAPDGRSWVNTSGGPALAKGGSGDTLTGLLAALTAQFGTHDWLRVLALGVLLHGVAADLLTLEEEPSGVLATEVAEWIPRAREWLLRELQFGA